MNLISLPDSLCLFEEGIIGAFSFASGIGILRHLVVHPHRGVMLPQGWHDQVRRLSLVHCDQVFQNLLKRKISKCTRNLVKKKYLDVGGCDFGAVWLDGRPEFVRHVILHVRYWQLNFGRGIDVDVRHLELQLLVRISFFVLFEGPTFEGVRVVGGFFTLVNLMGRGLCAS
jgi:hypothetical protein